MLVKSVATALSAALLLSAGACAHPHRDRDDNPPGPAGGPGTNWENPAGPVGGPGASPDRYRGPIFYAYPADWRRARYRGAIYVYHPRRACWLPDFDDNPPGPAGGRGTNWENPAGPAGGPGASPNRNLCR